MKFGKTDAQVRERDEAWKWRYALIPVPLHDGSWIWLEKYVVRLSSADPHGGPGVSMGAYPQRFLEIPPQRERSAPPPRK